MEKTKNNGRFLKTDKIRNKKPLLGVLIGKAPSARRAKSITDFFNKCPYCAVCTNKDFMVFGILSFPFEHRWWFESIVTNPKETMGLQSAEIFFADKIKASSPWSSGKVKPVLDRPPCGASCQRCPMLHKECKGCPATKYYLD